LESDFGSKKFLTFYHATDTWALDTGSLLRLHFTPRPVRIEWVGRRVVAAGILRFFADVLLFCRNSHIPGAA
jgi:hypothetical protein